MYEKYKEIKSEKEFFEEMNRETLDCLDGKLKKYMYNKYVLKCTVFQRDNFSCHNINCKTPESKITLHHIRFRKNEGADKLKNCVTVCKTCHKNFHRGKDGLMFNGMTYKIDIRGKEINWKKVKATGRVIRKSNKRYHGIILSWELIRLLLKFIMTDYRELEASDDD